MNCLLLKIRSRCGLRPSFFLNYKLLIILNTFPTSCEPHACSLLRDHTNANSPQSAAESYRTWILFHIRCNNSWKRSKLGVSTRYCSIKEKKIKVKIGNRCLRFVWYAQKDLDNLLLLAAWYDIIPWRVKEVRWMWCWSKTMACCLQPREKMTSLAFNIIVLN